MVLIKKSICLVLAVMMVIASFVFVSASEKDYKSILNNTLDSMVEVLKKNKVDSANVWFVMDIARAGRTVSSTYFDQYYAACEEYVKATIPTVNVEGATNALHKNKSVENSRLILGLSAIGKYSTDVAGYDLTAPYESFKWIKKQGIMGPVWTLISLDTYGYETKDSTIRQQCVDYLLNCQLADGRWDLGNKNSDVDVTAMVLQSLVNYKDQKNVAEAADKAFTCLSNKQMDNGGFDSWGTKNSESCVQVIVACCTWGIDPNIDSRFVKNGVSAVDNLLTFSVKSDKYGYGFAHVMEDATSGSYSYTGGEYNSMATEQACYGLIAYDRFVNSKNTLYDMADAKPAGEIPSQEDMSKEKEEPSIDVNDYDVKDDNPVIDNPVVDNDPVSKVDSKTEDKSNAKEDSKTEDKSNAKEDSKTDDESSNQDIIKSEQGTNTQDNSENTQNDEENKSSESGKEDKNNQSENEDKSRALRVFIICGMIVLVATCGLIVISKKRKKNAK